MLATCRPLLSEKFIVLTPFELIDLFRKFLRISFVSLAPTLSLRMATVTKWTRTGKAARVLQRRTVQRQGLSFSQPRTSTRISKQTRFSRCACPASNRPAPLQIQLPSYSSRMTKMVRSSTSRVSVWWPRPQNTTRSRLSRLSPLAKSLVRLKLS